ncbi:MAG: glycosyltransferase family 4 protein [Phycisphaerae bacterium]|jgi:UDP-glucose:(heptosyl)LPS alpha-1,3-glucosyltransferase
MRIAIVQEHVDVRRGGAESSTLEMAAALAELGHDVTLLHSGDPAPDAAAAAPNARTLRLQPIAARGATRLRRTREYLRRAAEHCRTGGYDIVHAVVPLAGCHVYQPRGGTYAETIARSAALAGSTWGRALKRLSRRLNRRQQFLLRAERSLLSGHDAPVTACVSEYVRRQVLAEVPSPPGDAVQVVFNGVDVQCLTDEAAEAARSAWRAARGVRADELLALFVAHNFKLKGLAELIRALALPSRITWRLAVVGRDNPRPFHALARRLEVAHRVDFVGAMPDARTAYAAADVLAHPTWYDPCSRVVLEALCCGLPVVTTRFNGAAEALMPGVNGIVIDSPRDTAALARAIERCLAPELKAGARAARAAARERLSMRRHARELAALYERIRGRVGGASVAGPNAPSLGST